MGNELKLSLENFQSISQGELIFHTGTNVIVGQSNSGKSATFRALKACLINPKGSQRFIKKGKGSSTVTLEYNGNQIIWKRSDKESSYIINGEHYPKTGASSAVKIMGMEETGFVIDLNDMILNIEEELQLPFPFGLSKTDLFKLFENVFCVSDSAIILKSAKKAEDEVSNNLTFLNNDLTKNKNKLEELQQFKGEVDLGKLNKMCEFLEKAQDKLRLLNDGLPLIKKAVAIQDFHIDDFNIESKLEDYQSLTNLKETIIKLKELHKLGQELKGNSLEVVSVLDDYKDTVALKKVLEQTKELHKVGQSLKELSVEITPVLDDYEDLNSLKKVSEQLKELQNLSVGELEIENHLDEYMEKVAYLKFLKDLQQKIKNKKAQLTEVEATIKELEEKLKEFKVCPLCLRPLD